MTRFFSYVFYININSVFQTEVLPLQRAPKKNRQCLISKDSFNWRVFAVNEASFYKSTLGHSIDSSILVFISWFMSSSFTPSYLFLNKPCNNNSKII